MSIHFDLELLPKLYWFKNQTISLCIDFITKVIQGSHRSRIRQLQSKLKDIEVDLYDLFCRWNFIAINNKEFDLSTFLPTSEFIIMNDIEYYLSRFGVKLSNSFIEFPHERFNQLRNSIQSLSCPKQITPSSIQIQRLISIYRGSDFELDSKRLIARYQYLGGLNNSLSVPPAILDITPSHELFGTPLNTHTSFCSPFDDEKIFSSHGSFFNFEDYRDDVTYFANPPFDDSFCSMVATRLLEQLTKKRFHLIVIIPVWDTDEQKKRGLKDFGLPFDCYNRLVKSEYFISENFLEKDKYHFFNYFSQKKVFISNVHIINLGLPVDVDKIMQVWA